MSFSGKQKFTKCHFNKILKISPFGRGDFISSASLQVICGRLLQQHALQLAAKANSIREISGLNL